MLMAHLHEIGLFRTFEFVRFLKVATLISPLRQFYMITIAKIAYKV